MKFNALSYTAHKSAKVYAMSVLYYFVVAVGIITTTVMLVAKDFSLWGTSMFVLIGIFLRHFTYATPVPHEALASFANGELRVISKNAEFSEIVIPYSNIAEVRFKAESETVLVFLCKKIKGTTLSKAHIISVDRSLLTDLSNAFYSYMGKSISDIPETSEDYL